MAVPLALALAPALIQTGTGIGQSIAGARRRKRQGDIETYKTPSEVADFVKSKQMQAASDLPGRSQIEEDIAATTASTLRAGQDVADPYSYLDLLTKAKVNEMTQKRDLGYQSALFKDRKRAEADQALLTAAQFDEKEQESRISDQEREAMVTSALLGSGLENITTGLGGAANIGAARYKKPTTKGGGVSDILNA